MYRYFGIFSKNPIFYFFSILWIFFRIKIILQAKSLGTTVLISMDQKWTGSGPGVDSRNEGRKGWRTGVNSHTKHECIFSLNLYQISPNMFQKLSQNKRALVFIISFHFISSEGKKLKTYFTKRKIKMVLPFHHYYFLQ